MSGKQTLLFTVGLAVKCCCTVSTICFPIWCGASVMFLHWHPHNGTCYVVLILHNFQKKLFKHRLLDNLATCESRVNAARVTDETALGERDEQKTRGGWHNLSVLVCASLADVALYITKGAGAKGSVWYPCVMWWNVLSHRSKADSLKTSHVLICQRYKWEQTKSNSPIPTPLCFIFHSLLHGVSEGCFCVPLWEIGAKKQHISGVHIWEKDFIH